MATIKNACWHKFCFLYCDGFICIQHLLDIGSDLMNIFFQISCQHGRQIQNGRYQKYCFQCLMGYFACIIFSTLSTLFLQNGCQYGHHIKMASNQNIVFRTSSGLLAYRGPSSASSHGVSHPIISEAYLWKIGMQQERHGYLRSCWGNLLRCMASKEK